MTDKTCPCGSELDLANCCQPLISGKTKATTAEQLLRARYSAFVVGGKAAIDFILKTHHSKTAGDVNREEIEAWSKNSEWHGLQIVQKEAGKAKDTEGRIVFNAKYTSEGKEQDHWEQSFFEKEAGDWKFLDAKAVHVGTYKREAPKLGRNDPCPCGSGKKSKKCCAA